MPRWTEGIDYKVLKSGKVRCLYCERELGKTELSPHLSTCPDRLEETEKAHMYLP
jgi:hypothetical protein